METKKRFDIHDRIFQFILRVFKLIRALPRTFENKLIIEQLGRSVTSIGANDQEANGVSTQKDFSHCYTVVRKETLETLFLLRLLAELNPSFKVRMQSLLQENEELIKIVSTIL